MHSITIYIKKSSAKLTDTVKHYKDYLPEFFPLVHPSPRNNIWQAKKSVVYGRSSPRFEEFS